MLFGRVKYLHPLAKAAIRWPEGKGSEEGSRAERGILERAHEPGYSQRPWVRRAEQVRMRGAEQWRGGRGNGGWVRRKTLNWGREARARVHTGRTEVYQPEAAGAEPAREPRVRCPPARPPARPPPSSGPRGRGQSPGVGAPQGLDQALLLLLEAGEAAGGPRRGGGGALGQREEPAHPPRLPGPEALAGPAGLSRRLSRGSFHHGGADGRPGREAGRPRLLYAGPPGGPRALGGMLRLRVPAPTSKARHQTRRTASLPSLHRPQLPPCVPRPLCVPRHQPEPPPGRTRRDATAQLGAAQRRPPFPPRWARGVYGASAAAAAPATAAAAECCLYGEEEEEKRELGDTSRSGACSRRRGRAGGMGKWEGGGDGGPGRVRDGASWNGAGGGRSRVAGGGEGRELRLGVWPGAGAE